MRGVCCKETPVKNISHFLEKLQEKQALTSLVQAGYYDPKLCLIEDLLT